MRLSPVFALVSLLLAAPASAQKVVILELDGDPQGKLRAQIENAVKAAGVVELVPLKAYKDAAARKKMKGAAAMTPAGVARAAKLLSLDAAVGGEVDESTFRVLISDRAGEQLWKKELAVKKGVLSDDFAGKLARAIAAAAEQGAARAATTPPAGGEEAGGEELPGLDLTKTDGTGQAGVVSGGSPPAEDRDTDLEDPNRKNARASKRVVPIVRAWVAGSTTWRSQCLRPGVTACREYELAQPPPSGISIDFTASVPYLGLSLNAELFPLAPLVQSPLLQGILGLQVGFLYGQSQTRIVEETPQGQGPEKIVKSDDLGLSLNLLSRLHFELGYGDPKPLGWIGLHGGLQSRSFLIDPMAGTSLPSSDRVAPTGIGFFNVGLDGALPLNRYLRFEASASLFLDPRPAAEQIIGYGNLNDPTGGATGTGLAVEAGIAGELWGPLGYVVRWRYMGFTDRYFGQGQKWTICNEQQCGGVGEESFHSIIWGITASY